MKSSIKLCNEKIYKQNQNTHYGCRLVKIRSKINNFKFNQYIGIRYTIN